MLAEAAPPLENVQWTQSVAALNSAESEFYATTKAATAGIGMITLVDDMGMHKNIVMEVDASAALGVSKRRGIGRIQHLQTSALSLQEHEVRYVIRFHKSAGSDIFPILSQRTHPGSLPRSILQA